MMMQNLKKFLLKFKLQYIFCLCMLLLISDVSAQDKKCNYKNFWFKADYKNLRHAEKEKNRYADILKSKKVNDTLLAKAYNITGLYYDFSGNQDSAIICFKKALALLKKYPAKQIALMVNLATEYNIIGSFDTSLKWSNKAFELNDKYGNDIYKAHIYHAIAAAYLYKDDIEKATDNILKGIKILKKKNDNCYLGLFKVTLAGTYLQSNNYGFAADLLEEYLAKNKDDKENKVYIVATINYTENLIELDQINKANTLLVNIIRYAQNPVIKKLKL